MTLERAKGSKNEREALPHASSTKIVPVDTSWVPPRPGAPIPTVSSSVLNVHTLPITPHLSDNNVPIRGVGGPKLAPGSGDYRAHRGSANALGRGSAALSSSPRPTRYSNPGRRPGAQVTPAQIIHPSVSPPPLMVNSNPLPGAVPFTPRTPSKQSPGGGGNSLASIAFSNASLGAGGGSGTLLQRTSASGQQRIGSLGPSPMASAVAASSNSPPRTSLTPSSYAHRGPSPPLSALGSRLGLPLPSSPTPPGGRHIRFGREHMSSSVPGGSSTNEAMGAGGLGLADRLSGQNSILSSILHTVEETGGDSPDPKQHGLVSRAVSISDSAVHSRRPSSRAPQERERSRASSHFSATPSCGCFGSLLSLFEAPAKRRAKRQAQAERQRQIRAALEARVAARAPQSFVSTASYGAAGRSSHRGVRASVTGAPQESHPSAHFALTPEIHQAFFTMSAAYLANRTSGGGTEGPRPAAGPAPATAHA